MIGLRLIFYVTSLITVLWMLAGCIPPGTNIKIDSPADGVTVERNKEMQIAVTAADAIGVTRIELWDAGAPVLTARSTVPEGQTVFVVTFAWTPKDLGSHVLVAKAYNRESNDRESALAVLTLTVGEGVTPTITLTPTVTRTGNTPTPTRSATPGPSLTPTISPTPTPPPTGTPPPSPSAPSSLAATGTGTTIRFSWQDNSTTELGFRIYEQGVVAPVADNIPAHVGTGGMSFDLKDLPCNKSGAFSVKSFNAAGESAASASVNAITIPCAPANLSVTPASSTSINLAFTSNATNETGYRVYQTNSPTALGTITAAPGVGGKSGSITGLPCGTTTAYFVRAFNAAGESSNSNTSEVTTLACAVTITFTQIRVIDDSNPKPPSCGGLIPCNATLWMDFTVNTQAKRWPSTGTIKAATGDVIPIPGTSYVFSLVRGQSLTIVVNGTDQHSFQPDHPLGTISKTYLGVDNWGAGAHTDKSTCPGGCYELTYVIEVAP